MEETKDVVRMCREKNYEILDARNRPSECGKKFTITEEEQKYYWDKGFQLPKRCQECRDKRKIAGAQKLSGQ